MGYLGGLIGETCFKCKKGYWRLLDKGEGVLLACSNYPKCDFISLGAIQCPKCEKGHLIIERMRNREYLTHSSCGYESLYEVPMHKFARGFTYEESLGKPNSWFQSEDIKTQKVIQKVKDEGLLVEYLTTLSFEELSRLWDEQVWVDATCLPVTDYIDEEFIKQAIQKTRSVKWKLSEKKKME
jgi:ssDNA-binding Zn-finger/Zn-ribbon topoisomerase 1